MHFIFRNMLSFAWLFNKCIHFLGIAMDMNKRTEFALKKMHQLDAFR